MKSEELRRSPSSLSVCHTQPFFLPVFAIIQVTCLFSSLCWVIQCNTLSKYVLLYSLLLCQHKNY